MKRFGHAASLLCLAILAVSPASADIIYDVDFTPDLGIPYPFNFGNPIEAFSFSFASPTFVSDSTILSFTPFDITDGVNSVLIDFGEAFGFDQGCFIADSSSTVTATGPCSGDFSSAPTAGDAAFFGLGFSTGLPTTTGLYSAGGEVLFHANAVDNGTTHGNFTVTVSDSAGGSAAPEPSSITLLAFGLGIFSMLYLNRTVTTKNS